MSTIVDPVRVPDSASSSSAPVPPVKTIPLKILPTAAPKVITTAKTLRRCCGFSLALVGFIFYCLRALLSLWWVVASFLFQEAKNRQYTVLIFEVTAASLGIVQFLRIMRDPRITLQDSNFKNVWFFGLIPLFSFAKCFFITLKVYSYILPSFELVFYSGYIYGLSLDGRSHSMWAGFKPYRYAPVPLILPIPPASRAFPQYTIPV